MDFKIEWPEILMVLGSAVGGVISVLLYVITKNNLSLVLFPLGLMGGWVLGFLISKVLCCNK